MPPVRTKSIKGMDGYSDPASLQDGVVRYLKNMRSGKGGLYTREGNSKYNSTVAAGSSGIFGLGIYTTPSNTQRPLAVSGGYLHYHATGFLNQVADAPVTVGNLCQIIPFRTRALVCDQTLPVVEYWETIIGAATTFHATSIGLPSPKTTKLISSFETATDFTIANGSKTDSPNYATHGKQALKVQNTTGTTCTLTKTENLDLSGTATFADGSLSVDTDYISIFLIRSTPSAFTSCTLTFTTSAGKYFSTDLMNSKLWSENQSPSAGVTFRVRKADFNQTASPNTPNWATITSWAISFGSAGVVSLICDWLRLEKSGPIAYEHNKMIARMEDTESGITFGATGTTAWVSDYTARSEGGQALRVTADQTITLTFGAAKNLKTFTDGSVAADTDDIQIYLGKSKTAGAPTVVINCYTLAGNWWTTTITPSQTEGLAAVQVSKADFTVGGGAPDWESITYITLVVATNSNYVFVDEISLIKHKDSLAVDALDSITGWTTSGSPVTIAANANLDFVQTNEGSLTSLKIKQTSGTTGYILKQLGASTINLNVFSTNVAVSASDEIGLFIWMPNWNRFKSITLTLGPTGLANHYVSKTFDVTEIKTLAMTNVDRPLSTWFRLFADKDNWEETGTMVWTAVADLKISWVLAKGISSMDVYVDSWSIKRVEALSGFYSYKVVYVTPDGERSDASLPSDIIAFNGDIGYLTAIPLAGGAKISAREIYRVGGTKSNWQLVAVLEDDTTTTFLDEVDDEELGVVLTEEEGQPYIPKVMAVLDEYVVLGNLTTADGVTYPCGVQVSLPNSCEVYPTRNFFEIETGTTQIIAMKPAFNMMFVGKEDSLWKFNPRDLSEKPQKVSPVYGVVGPLAMDVDEDAIYFLDPSGVIKYNNAYFDVISEATSEHPSSIANYIEAIPVAYLNKCWIKCFVGLVLVGLVEAGGTYPTVILVWDTVEKMWFAIESANTSWDARCAATYKSQTEGDVLLLGHATAGWVYKGLDDSSDVDVPTTGSNARIASEVWFGDRDFDQPEQGKDWEKIILFGKALTATAANVTLTLYANGTAEAQQLTEDREGATLTFDSQVSKRLDVPGIQLGYFPSYLGLKIGVTDRWQFRGLIEELRFEGAK